MNNSFASEQEVAEFTAKLRDTYFTFHQGIEYEALAIIGTPNSWVLKLTVDYDLFNGIIGGTREHEFIYAKVKSDTVAEIAARIFSTANTHMRKHYATAAKAAGPGAQAPFSSMAKADAMKAFLESERTKPVSHNGMLGGIPVMVPVAPDTEFKDEAQVNAYIDKARKEFFSDKPWVTFKPVLRRDSYGDAWTLCVSIVLDQREFLLSPCGEVVQQQINLTHMPSSHHLLLWAKGIVSAYQTGVTCGAEKAKNNLMAKIAQLFQ